MDPNSYRLFQTNELASLGIAHKRKWASLETGRTVSAFTQTLGLVFLPATIVPALFNPSFIAFPAVRFVAMAALAAATVPHYLRNEIYNEERINGHKKAAMDICGYLATASWKGESPDAVSFHAKHCKEWPLIDNPVQKFDWRDVDWHATMVCEGVMHNDETRYEK